MTVISVVLNWLSINMRVYTTQQWMDIIEKARHRKPFKTISPDQSMLLDYANHFTTFKKTVKREQP